MSNWALCITACILIACHNNQAVGASSVEAYGLPSDLNGLSFVLEPQLQRQHQPRQQQQQNVDQQQQQQQLDNDDLFRLDNVKRASLKEINSMDSGNVLRQPSNQDLWRMIRLDQVLESLASSIPPTAGSNWPKNRTDGPNGFDVRDVHDLLIRQRPEPLVDQVIVSPAPTRAPSPTFGSMVGARVASAKAGLMEQWPGVGGPTPLNMLAGDPRVASMGSPKSRKSTNSAGGLMGLVWPTSKPSGGVQSAAGGTGGGPASGVGPTPFFPAQQPQMATRKLSIGRGQTTQAPSSLSSSSSHNHHRLGTEEVALHTPIHSSSGSDYEWKRVENSRSWNNLRGMWGKRAISEQYNDLETFRNMLETEARESGLSKSAGGLPDATSSDNDDDNDGGSVGIRQVRQAGPVAPM